LDGSLGAQIAVAVVTASTPTGSPYPAASGYTTAFALSAAALAVAALVVLIGTRRKQTG
jgi:hypothetical protein